MPTDEVTPNREHIPLSTRVLFTTWLYSLLWGGGIFLSAMAFFGVIMAGLLSFFETPIWNVVVMLILILGLAATFSSPILLRVTIIHDRQKNINAGLVPFLVSILTFLVLWVSAGVFYQWTSDYIYFFYSLLISLPACSAIVTLILMAKPHQYRIFELLTGVVTGMALSIISVLLGKNLLKGDNMLYLVWQIPSLVWISVVYFAELLAGRSKWKDFFVWTILALISFGLPFVVVPLFPFE